MTSGNYSYPLGNRVIRKFEQIVREEMNRAGAQEVFLPMVQPSELWQESGRWVHYGKELLRFRDRHEREYCLGPTHEEVITDLVRNEIKTYRQLPRNLYQIQTKFRDEIRPRFGVMRCREFGMKDAYSFDADEAGAEASYRKMFEAYNRIFTRCGLKFRRGGGLGEHRGELFPRIHGDRRFRRGCDRPVRDLPVRGQSGKGRGRRTRGAGGRRGAPARRGPHAGCPDHRGGLGLPEGLPCAGRQDPSTTPTGRRWPSWTGRP
jgi:hypothetical protein